MANESPTDCSTTAPRPVDTDVPESAPAAPPCAMVIFGAAGDLTKRLVVPALYNLVNAKRLPEHFQLVGVDLAPKAAEQWQQGLTGHDEPVRRRSHRLGVLALADEPDDLPSAAAPRCSAG